ncbi:MAG: SDR family NAD(P)-dependent oxidoreductase, partial [Deltaproteobacteria bacterium]|nr:SDR family NAD(P)-dependent oxidoreductase [Deltaproteobacteria bacterium]
DETDRVLREAMDGRDVHAAVLNAGITHFGDDAELSWDAFQNMIDVNVTSVMRMVRALIPHIETRSPGGGVLLVSSMAGLTPVPYQSAYSATKAFLVNYGLSMTAELEGRPVSLTVFAPGGIQTEMTSGERFRALGGWLMPVAPAAEAALEGLRRREFLSVPGAFMRTGTSLLGLIPRRFLTRQVGAVYRRGLAKASRAGG